MAGSGDMMNQMIRLVADRGIADKFHFPGFLKGKQVYEMLKSSDVYVMPSVSEPGEGKLSLRPHDAAFEHAMTQVLGKLRSSTSSTSSASTRDAG